MVARIALVIPLAAGTILAGEEPTRVYIACDDHTDYVWTADEAGYRKAFLRTLDYFLDLADRTDGKPADFQSRFVCDGSHWLRVYEEERGAAAFARLAERVRSGHISAPMTTLVSCYGGMPAEAVLRDAYYAGRLERRHGIRFRLALEVENQTLPWGLASLWAGCGARYTWKGICGCATRLPHAGDREHELYRWVGPDGQSLLVKWNSMRSGNQGMGGYAEARNPAAVVEYVTKDREFRTRYPYPVIGCFGKGWDDLETMTDEFVRTAERLSTPARRVIASNEIDFFEDVERTCGRGLPAVSYSFGNEWDLLCASLADVSARVKRAIEKLRAAEALATIVSMERPSFLDGRDAARERAWAGIGLYWEHCWTGDGAIPRHQRGDWQRRIAGEIAAYIDSLHEDGAKALGSLIPRAGAAERYFVFNPLGWTRTDAADLPRRGADPVHAVDLATGVEVPSQIVTRDGTPFLRILARDLPPAGYKVHEIRPGVGRAIEPAGSFRDGTMETRAFRIRVAGTGTIESLVDRRSGREYVRRIDGRAVNDLGPGEGEVTLEDAGPVSITVKAVAKLPIAHATRITLYKEIDRIDIANEITQNFAHTATVAFAFDLKDPECRHEEVGAIARARIAPEGHYAARNARYDWLTMNHFADMTGSDGAGIAISNADCYFFRLGKSDVARLDIETPQITALIGGQVDGTNLGIRSQGGDSRFLVRFALRPHAGYDPVEAMRFALEHQNPPVCGRVTGEDPALPAEVFSAIRVSNPSILLWAFKPAEEGIAEGVIARLWNLSEVPARARIRLGTRPIREARRTTHIETDEEPEKVAAGAIEPEFAPQALRTFRLLPTAAQAQKKAAGGERASLNLVPWPRTIDVAPGEMTLGPQSRIVAGDGALAPLAEVLASEILLAAGRRLPAAAGASRPGDIAIGLDPELKEEAYVLEVGEAAVIRGGTYAAAAMGTATLLQAIVRHGDRICIPRMTVRDEPASPYRGLLVDVARQWNPVEVLERCIILSRLYKIRYLQLHLTDDQMCVFPSKAFPKISADNRAYTLEELRHIEQFAAERGVAIIPELEGPGHSGRLRSVLPGSGGVLDMTDERLYEMLDVLVGEICEVFRSSPYFHIGADEASFHDVRNAPGRKAYLERYGLEDNYDIYCRYIVRLNEIIKKHGKRTIVWEGFQGDGSPRVKIPRDVTVMEFELSYNPPATLLDHGFTIINASWTPLYVLGERINRPPREIYAWDLYQFKWFGSESQARGLRVEPTPRVPGAQMCSWEMPGEVQIPSLRTRLPAMAERIWNPDAAGRGYDDFARRLMAVDEGIGTRLMDIPAAIVLDGIVAEDRLPPERLNAPLSTYRFRTTATATMVPVIPGSTIRYTLDGTEPAASSPEWKGPVRIEDSAKVRAKCFDAQGRRIGYEYAASFELHPIVAEVKGTLSEIDASLPPDSFCDPMTVTLRSSLDAARIRYTLDGGHPNAPMIPYSEPITLAESATVRAQVFDAAGKAVGRPWVAGFVRRDYRKSLTTGRPVKASSYEGDRIPEYAADGLVMRERAWWAAPYPQWLQVELSDPAPIDRIDVFPFWDGARSYQYTVDVSLDGGTWTQVVDMTANTDKATEAGHRHAFAPVRARLLRITMLKNTANAGVHLVEIRAFAGGR